ncbi:uncharacterized protein [Antedon mediterranea]|uniref:uncharacterized protein n=1 Tax=Antedon mediterranea TaxID=105859 RepID=UPI003AF6CC97
MEASSSGLTTCPFCRGYFHDKNNVATIKLQKGVDTINTMSKNRGDSIHVTIGQQIHKDCRKKYTHPSELPKKEGPSRTAEKRKSRADSSAFISSTDCVFCGTRVDANRSEFSYVKTSGVVKSIKEIITNVRKFDTWSLAVNARIEFYGSDLHAADAIYHRQCYRNFQSGLAIPVRFQSSTGEPAKRKRSGRPIDEGQAQAFSQVCSFLESNDEEQLTISNLKERMKEFIDDESEPYTNKHMKNRLRERYQDNICISEGDGYNDLVNYLRSAYFYLQQMNRLKDDHPDVYDRFCKGLNVVRRTNKFWAGVSCDLAIEQTLMRSVKSTGGLTRGSKMSEHSRMLWVLTRPCMSAFNESMQSFTNKTFATSDQHKEAAPSSIHRDTIDTDKLLAKLNGCSPFSMELTLRNIVNGMVANDDVNVLQYQMVAESVISQMKQQLVFSHKFKRKERARTLAEVPLLLHLTDL